MADTTIAIAQQTALDRMVARQHRIIAEAERMRELSRATLGYSMQPWETTIRQAKAEIAALERGLLPLRISGRSFPLKALITEAQNVPTEIVQKAQEAEAMFPKSEARVYGWDREALPEERRRRDPVLVLHYAGQRWFLGFWLELATGDEAVPEFFGITAPWSPPRGPGRPRKISLPRHELLK